MLKDFLGPLDLWKVYAPVLASGLISMVWASHQADRPARTRRVLRTGAITLTLGLIGLALFHRVLVGAAVSLWLFVVGFAMIEPVLASLVTRYTGKGARGTAAGLFNMSQFGGAFFDVMAEGDYVAPGSRVQVVEIDGSKVIVKEV